MFSRIFGDFCMTSASSTDRWYGSSTKVYSHWCIVARCIRWGGPLSSPSEYFAILLRTVDQLVIDAFTFSRWKISVFVSKLHICLNCPDSWVYCGITFYTLINVEIKLRKRWWILKVRACWIKTLPKFEIISASSINRKLFSVPAIRLLLALQRTLWKPLFTRIHTQ